MKKRFTDEQIIGFLKQASAGLTGHLSAEETAALAEGPAADAARPPRVRP
jgi:hypothetical protein